MLGVNQNSLKFASSNETTVTLMIIISIGTHVKLNAVAFKARHRQIDIKDVFGDFFQFGQVELFYFGPSSQPIIFPSD